MKTPSVFAAGTLFFVLGSGCSSPDVDFSVREAGTDDGGADVRVETGGGGAGGDGFAPRDADSEDTAVGSGGTAGVVEPDEAGPGECGDGGNGVAGALPCEGGADADDDAAEVPSDSSDDIPPEVKPDSDVDDGAVDAPWDVAADVEEKEACVDETAMAGPVPLDIYFMIDTSTSMSLPVGNGMSGDCDVSIPTFVPAKPSRWCNSVNAVAGYISSSEAKGNRAALGFFAPYPNGSHTCGGSKCAVPSVGLGGLSDVLTGDYSGHAKLLVEANPGGLNWAYPHSGTPTEEALRGLAKFTEANQEPGRIIIGILVTDGAPGGSYGCNLTDAVLKGIAQTHFDKTGIHTFMVGITGSDWTRLENWASYDGAISHDNVDGSCGNGATACHHYNVGNADPTVFRDALMRIQKSVLSCTFQVPVPSSGILDISKVKVEYGSDGSAPEVLQKRASEAACSGPGWYFDDPKDPKFINLCPDTCAVVGIDEHAVISIRIPCEE